ncbi:Cytochrome D1 heme domain protein [uncultured archaeon]|nr:Cytochrome D1 heme domain protein [uncultured archaeon]
MKSNNKNESRNKMKNLYRTIGETMVSYRICIAKAVGIMMLTLIVLTGGVSAAPFAYITTSGNFGVSVIDTATNQVIETIGVGDQPTGVAVNPEGTRVFVTNWGDIGNTVSVIDTTTNKVIDTVAVGIHPYGVAFYPLGGLFPDAYVTNGDGTVSVIDGVTNKVTLTLPVGKVPTGIAVIPPNPNGGNGNVFPVYVVNSNDNTVSVLESPVFQTPCFQCPYPTIPVGQSPVGVAMLPLKKPGDFRPNAYVTNYKDNTVSIIDTDKQQVIDTVAVGQGPIGVAVTPDGTNVYITNSKDSTVSIIDTATHKVIDTVYTVGGSPNGVAVTPDGKQAYVANSNTNTVAVIDTATHKVIKIVPVGSRPVAFGLFIGPETPPIVQTVQSSTGKGPVSFETSSGAIRNLYSEGVPTIPSPPSGTNLFYGLFNFDITGITAGSSAILTITFPNSLPVGTTYWKYQASHNPSWYSITPDAINGNELKLTLIDGGIGDSDNTVNGVIHDPGGPSIPGGILPKTGDINGDGKLTLVDAIYLAKHVGGFSGYETIYADGDINANGKVTLVDAIYLAKHVGGFSGYETIY